MPVVSRCLLPYTIKYEPNGVYVAFSGQISFKDILQATYDFWQQPDFEYMDYEIFDYLTVTSLEVSEYDAIEMAVRDDVASKTTRRSKIAIIATLPDIIEQTEIYRQTLKDKSVAVLVTDNIKHARDWTGASHWRHHKYANWHKTTIQHIDGTFEPV